MHLSISGKSVSKLVFIVFEFMLMSFGAAVVSTISHLFYLACCLISSRFQVVLVDGSSICN